MMSMGSIFQASHAFRITHVAKYAFWLSPNRSQVLQSLVASFPSFSYTFCAARLMLYASQAPLLVLTTTTCVSMRAPSCCRMG